MPSKPKEKDSKSNVPETVEQINLQKYCPKQIFDILLLSEADEYSRDVLNLVIEEGRKYEEMSCLTFITFNDVADLVRRHESVVLPPRVKPTLEDICNSAEEFIELEEKMPSKLLAQLMKLKLTEVMYQHYIKEVNKMQKRKKLEEDLNILTKECKKAGSDAGKGKGKGGKSTKDSKSGTTSTDKKKGKDKGSGKSAEVKPIEDYTEIPIESEHDLVFDDDIVNHVWFYAFQGFYDAEILHELYLLNVPLTAVIKVTADTDGETTISDESLCSLYNEYWDNCNKYFDGPKRLVELENTILMNFVGSGFDFKEILQQLLYVIKNISDIKLQHVNYVRHINIYEVREIYNYFPLECLSVYNKTMDKIPYELTNEIVLLNCLLSEVHTRLSNTKSTLNILENSSGSSIRSLNKYSTTKCIDPCKIDMFFKSKQKMYPERMICKKLTHDFVTHECDKINIILNFYKKYGPLVCDPVLQLLKTQICLHMLNKYQADYMEVLHKHDTAPTTKTITEDDEIIMHIFYLIFFSNFDCKEIVADFQDTDLTENLQTYQKIDFVRSVQTVVREDFAGDENVNEDAQIKEIQNYEGFGIDEGEDENCEGTINSVIEEAEEENVSIQINSVIEEEIDSKGKLIVTDETHDGIKIERQYPNYYSKSTIQYFWKETMSSDVLLQEVYKAHQEYLHMEQRFSPGTDNLLLQFSDCLDEFGINTKIYDQSLITPICLRDFCRYVSVEKAEWLKNHKPPKYFRKCEEIEICKGVNRINQLQWFREYSHLLESTMKTENESEEKPQINDGGVTFEELLEELRKYPSNIEIANECKKPGYQKEFLAYDLGVNYFQIRGGKTTFHSHDDVKISVDNTRFLDEEPKCTVNLSSKGNSLIVHYNKFYFTRDFTFHMNLADGTIITFIILLPDIKKCRRRTFDSNEFNDLSSPEEVLIENVMEEESENPLEVLEEVKVLSVDEKYFKSLEKTHTNAGMEETGVSEFEFKETEDIFDSLRQAAASNCPIYKVNTNLTHLKRLKQEVEIPLSNILNRIMHKTIEKKKFGSFTKRYIPKRQKHKKVKRLFDARIAWPNGLYISFYPSQIRSSYVEVKQEFLNKKFESSLIEQEEFRLFTREGYILIKYIDGTVKILKSNGDIIYYEKLDANDELIKKWRLQQCHCKNINDYRKKLNRIMRRNYEPTTPAAISRRAQFHTKKGYVLNPDLVHMLEASKVPYLKSTLLKFNGNRICLEKGRVTQKRIFHVTDEQDFFAQEVYYERSDGFRSYFDRHGKQQVKFADGTKISSTIHVAKYLADGYVYISLNFQYEHPNYATVSYNVDKSLEVMLNNAVFKIDVNNIMSIKIDEDISATIKKDNAVFYKTCPKCSSKYKCSINVYPFSENKMYSSEIFVHAQDSYNKHFSCDYAGNCQRNSDYIKGPFNSFNCNHYKNMSYKKMFVVNRNFSGYMFWTDNMIESKREVVANDENVTVTDCTDINNEKVKVLTFRRKIFEQYNNRFLNVRLLKEQMCLAKYKQVEAKQLIYTTSRIIRKMTDFHGIMKYLRDIMKFFVNIGVGSTLLEILAKLQREQDSHPEDNMSKKIIVTEIPELPICKCIKSKVDMAGKIERWKRECGKYRQLIRNNVIHPYFTSEFCQVIETNT